MELGVLVTDSKSGFASGEDIADGVLQIRMNNVTADGRLDFTKQRRVPASARQLEQFSLCAGDVLFNSTNSPELVGKTALFPGLAEPVVFSNHFLRLRLDPARVYPAYVSRWLNYQFGRGVFRGLTQQWVNQASIRSERLLKTKVPLPPLDEQSRLMNIVDRAQDVLGARQRASNQLDALGASIFDELFGKRVSKHDWAIASVGAVSEQVTDGEHQTPIRADAGIKLLSARNVRDGYIDFENVDYIPEVEYERIKRRCDPRPGDVLISCSGTIGRVAAVRTSERFSLVRSAALVRPNQAIVTTGFLEQWLRTPALRSRMLQRARSSSQANLFQGQIRELPVLVPDMAAQQQLDERMKSVDRLREAHAAAMTRSAAMVSSLLSRAFAGEL